MTFVIELENFSELEKIWAKIRKSLGDLFYKMSVTLGTIIRWQFSVYRNRNIYILLSEHLFT